MGHRRNTTTKIATLFMVIIVAATMMSGCISEDNAPVTTSTYASSAAPTHVAVATPTQVPQTSVRTGTYESPTPLNTALVSDTGIFVIAVSQIVRGDRMDQKLKAENMYNEDPAPGNEYMAVLFFFYYNGQDKYSLSNFEFNAYANDVECPTPFVILPDEMVKFDTFMTIMPGGHTSGWKIFEVPAGEQVTLSYERTWETPYYLDGGVRDFDADTDNLICDFPK